jgi:DNA-binding NarL/FixJ family response regulator
MNEEKKRVVIVDDHPLFRDRLSQLINHEPDMQVCGESETAEQAIQLIRRLTPDLVIADITLKGSSGLELIKGIRALSIGIPVLVLSMHDESLYAERALRAGATGYITKNQAADEVLAAIRRVLTGEIYLSDKMTSDCGNQEHPATCRSLSGPRAGSPGIDWARQYDASDRGQT